MDANNVDVSTIKATHSHVDNLKTTGNVKVQGILTVSNILNLEPNLTMAY